VETNISSKTERPLWRAMARQGGHKKKEDIRRKTEMLFGGLWHADAALIKTLEIGC